MLEPAITKLQAQRLSDFLAFWLPRAHDWYWAQEADPMGSVLGGSLAGRSPNAPERTRLYKRDDDLADELIAIPQFRPVLEAFYLEEPPDLVLRATVRSFAPELAPEIRDLLASAVCISAGRLAQNPEILPRGSRLAVRLAAWWMTVHSAIRRLLLSRRR
jgi:hypothetical protein